MPQPPKELDPGRSARDWFGAELRHWRGLRRLSQAELGAKVHVSGDLIGKIEKAVRTCSPDLATALDRFLDTGGVLARALARTAADADNAPAHADNSLAGRLPGPVPTVPAAMLAADGSASPPDEPDTDGVRVPCRTAEGRIIFVTMPRTGPRASPALVPPAAVPPPAAPSVRDFLAVDGHPVDRLRELRRTLVQCENFLGAGHVFHSARDLLDLIDALVRRAAGEDRRALIRVQAEYAELCGWLCQDTGSEGAARFWTDRALEWSHIGGRPDAIAYVLVRKAQLAADRGDPVGTADLAHAAGKLAPPQSRFTVMGALSAAHGYALSREPTACRRTLDTVLGMLDQIPGGSHARRGNWLDSPHVQAQRAHALSLLGDHRAANDGFDRALRTLAPGYRRDRGYILSQAALGRLRADEPEQAALAGLQALPIALATGSARTFRALSTLDTRLPTGSSQPEVREYRAAFDAAVLHEA